MSPILGTFLVLACVFNGVDPQALSLKQFVSIRTVFLFYGPLLCNTVENGSVYASWVELWEKDGFFGSRIGDDHLEQGWGLNDTIFPHEFVVIAQDDGDGWDPEKVYEPYIRVNHNCTSDRSTIIQDFPITLEKGRFDIKTAQYVKGMSLDLTQKARHRRFERKSGFLS
ncbi:hypothetical protein B9Z55_000467 [Caenorhabditis nigoni]|uniref:DOMON domain-containing protein n=1 Tax=Caenorhabditis nigoni TaxID=1611254 RepID=A0A2G5VTA3_9PELO|nr:hypothetical protein B9Z55_000467 [Caenorhabditis nigoni]